MVADIRKGKLDRNLPVHKNVRTTFESMNLPRPDLSKRLDSTFRMLGTHSLTNLLTHSLTHSLRIPQESSRERY